MQLFCGFGFVLFLTTYVGSCQMKARLHESTKSFSKKKKWSLVHGNIGLGKFII